MILAGLAVLAAAGCERRPSRDECARLWRHMEDLMGRDMDPSARRRFAEKMAREADGEIDRCTREVSRPQLACALSASTESALDECQKL